MSAEISKKLHRPSLPQSQGQKTVDTETQREHIKGPQANPVPAKS